MSQVITMDTSQFQRHAAQLIDEFKPRIPESGIELIDIPLSGGEYGYAIEDLVGLIERYDIPVSGGERDEFRQLLGFLDADTSVVDGFRGRDDQSGTTAPA